jgi:hypothetical protein
VNDKPPDLPPDRRKTWLNELRQQPPIEISGVVGASGAGGGKSQVETSWLFSADFSAWKSADGQVQQREMQLLRQVSHDELKTLMDLFHAYDVLRLRARIIVDSEKCCALVETVLGKNSDNELEEIAAQLQKPVTLNVPELGTLTLDRRVNWFSGDIPWRSAHVQLNLDMNDAQSANDLTAMAQTIWKNQNAWEGRTKEYAAVRLLPLKNESWLDEDEDEVTARVFCERMVLESVTVHAADLEFYFRDGDLFWGHTILVSATHDGELIDAEICG